MTNKDFFIVGLRLFGVSLLLHMIDYAIAAFDFTVGFAINPNFSVYACYTHGSVYFVAGLYLLGGAPQIVRFFYQPIADEPVPSPAALDPKNHSATAD